MIHVSLKNKKMLAQKSIISYLNLCFEITQSKLIYIKTILHHGLWDPYNFTKSLSDAVVMLANIFSPTNWYKEFKNKSLEVSSLNLHRMGFGC